MATNTGYKGWLTLLKVVDGGEHDGEALDDNNNLCSQSGLPQSSKPNNIGDSDYIEPVEDLTSCPVPVINYRIDVAVGGGGSKITATLKNKATDEVVNAPQNLTVTFDYTTALSNDGSTFLVINTGQSTKDLNIDPLSGDSYESVTKTGVSPTTTTGGGTVE